MSEFDLEIASEKETECNCSGANRDSYYLCTEHEDPNLCYKKGFTKCVELIKEWATKEQTIAEFKELNLICGGIRISRLKEFLEAKLK